VLAFGALVASTATTATALPASTGGLTVSVGAPVRLSGDVPMAGACGTTNGNGPHAAIDPSHPTHVAVVYSVGNAAADAVASSTEGGATWTRQLLPGLTSCSNGPDGVPGDPMIAVGAGGSTVVSTGWVTNDQTTDVDNSQQETLRLLVNHAERLGQPFAGPVEPEPGGADQRGPISFAKGSNTDALIAFERLHYVNNPEFDITGGFIPGTGGSIAIATSTNGGRTWGSVRTVVEGQPGSDVVTVALVRSGAYVVLIYAVVDTSTVPGSFAGQGISEQLRSISSLDGITWSAAKTVGTYYYPHGKAQGCCIPDVSVAPDGTMYAAWPHFDDTLPTAKYDGIDLASSHDVGQSWTSTVITSSQLDLGAGEVYEPAIAAGVHGGLGIFFYEADSGPLVNPTATLPKLTARLAISGDAGRTWVTQALAPAFDSSAIQDGNQDGVANVGPYQDLVAMPDGYAATVTLGAGSSEAVWWFSVETRS
jgi:hypothetical protein